MTNQLISKSIADISLNKVARIAGFWYLMNAVFATLGVITRLSLVVPGDAATTANNIMVSEWLYLFGFMSNVFMLITGLFLPISLYLVFKSVDKGYSALFVLLLLMSVPLMAVSLVNQYAVLLILTDGNYLTVLGADQLYALMTLFLDLEEIGYTIAKIFFGLWLLPLGYLAYKSGYIPKILGVLLMIGCFSYLVDFFSFFLFPSDYLLISSIINLPTMFFELAFTFWLLLKGVNIPETKS